MASYWNKSTCHRHARLLHTYISTLHLCHVLNDCLILQLETGFEAMMVAARWPLRLIGLRFQRLPPSHLYILHCLIWKKTEQCSWLAAALRMVRGDMPANYTMCWSWLELRQ